jgi:steroid 5-alpha reductase family enzyme
MDRNTFIFIFGTVAASGLLLASGLGFFGGLVVAVSVFTLLWLVSLPLKNAGIVDIFWGVGFIVVGWYYLAITAETPTAHGWLVCTLVTIWGLRLALHIGIRNRGAGEDFRYAAWREQDGFRFWWISYFKVFLLQAIILWIVSSPLLLAHLNSGRAEFGLIELIGLGGWIFGFLFEVIADWQLSRFKTDPANRGKVMRTGLWSLSRHPNYFGEAVVWWGIGLIALPSGGWLAFLGPLMITFMLLKVSGVAMLDAALVKRRPGYAEYVEDTPAFLPLPFARRGRRRAIGKL